MLSLFSFENAAGSHAGTDAHGHDSSLLLGSLQLGEEGADHSSSSHTEWVTESNGSSSSVELAFWNIEVLDTVSGLTGEGFVDFIHIDVAHGKTAFLQGSWDGDGWANSHDFRWNTSYSEAENSSLDWQTMSLSERSSGNESNSSSIGGLTGVTSSSATSLLESWLQFGESFKSGLWPNSIISVDHDLLLISFLVLKSSLVDSNLILWPSHLLSMSSLGVTVDCHLI